jgi:hypothetical protein
MKVLSQLATAPIALLWDNPKPLMLVTIGLTDLAFQGDEGKVEQIEFAADTAALKRFAQDIAMMAATLEERAEKFGWDTTATELPPEEEELTEEQILEKLKASNISKLEN